jgi:hypothetical protein
VGTHAIFVFKETHVVTGDRDQEEQAIDVLEAMNPLLPLGSLTTDIKHSVAELAKIEDRLRYAGRP